MWCQKGALDLHMTVLSSSVSSDTFGQDTGSPRYKDRPWTTLCMFSVSCGLMVNIEIQQSMTALSGLHSALKQFPFLYVHLRQFV